MSNTDNTVKITIKFEHVKLEGEPFTITLPASSIIGDNKAQTLSLISEGVTDVIHEVLGSYSGALKYVQNFTSGAYLEGMLNIPAEELPSHAKETFKQVQVDLSAGRIFIESCLLALAQQRVTDRLAQLEQDVTKLVNEGNN